MTNKTPEQSRTDLAIPPGEFLAEELESVGMTQRELATRTGRPEQVISEIVHGRKRITYDTGLQLEKVLGISAHFWVNLESAYQLTLARNREVVELEQASDWVQQFPVKDLQKLGWIPRHSSPVDQARSLLEYFGVASFSAWREQQTAMGFRLTSRPNYSREALAAWARKGELEAKSIFAEQYSEQRFRMVLENLCRSTRVQSKEFMRSIKETCAASGVVVLFVRPIPKSGAFGIARWIAPNKALIQLSLRTTWADSCWFSFFHEAAHVLRHEPKRVFIDLDNGNQDPDEEMDADRFASDCLILRKSWDEFVARGEFSADSVRQFATDTNVVDGTVVGRLQHEKHIAHSQLNQLRNRIAWTDEGKGWF